MGRWAGEPANCSNNDARSVARSAQTTYGPDVAFERSSSSMSNLSRRADGTWLATLLVASVLSACTPTVKVEAPQEPITINLNIKLDADVRVKLEQEAKQDVASKSIF